MTAFNKKFLVCAATVLVSTLFLAQANAQTAPSQNQIADIMKTANDAEIDAAKVAKSKASDKAVKDFAEHMISEHQKNIKDAKAVEKAQKIKPDSNDISKAMKKDAKAKISDIKKLKGAEFDKAYIDQQVAMHGELLNDLESKFIPNTENADFKIFLETTKSHVADHLAKAKEIQANLK